METLIQTQTNNKQHSEMEPLSLKYDILKGKYYNFRCFSSNFLPIEALEQCIRNSYENAATKIQSAWRGYCCRKAYRENKTNMKESNAALVIQRSLREWFYKKKTDDSAKLENRTIYCLEKLDESKIPILQDEIKNWNKQSKHQFESQEKLQSQLETVQEQLKNFYERAATRKSRMQRCEAICTQIEAIVSVLTDLPSLVQCDQVDISLFHTPVVADAKIAKIRHKQQLKVYSAPWWKRLNKQNENFM